VQANPFLFLNFYDKAFNVLNKLENFNQFTNLSKDFGELDDKFII